jgi:hypothetical protein
MLRIISTRAEGDDHLKAGRLPGLARLGHGGGQVTGRAEERAGQQRAAHRGRELDNPVDAGHHPAHVAAQRERQRGGGVEVGGDVAEEVDGHHQPQRGDQGEHQHDLPGV